MSLVTIYQSNHPETLPVNLSTPELVLESELPTRLQTINNTLTGISYVDDGRGGYSTNINQSLTVNGNVASNNLTQINTTLMGISYEDETTTIGHNVVINGKLNGLQIGLTGTVQIPNQAPFLVGVNIDGVTEVGKHIDFHNVGNPIGEDYQTRLSSLSSGVLAIAGTSSFQATRFDTTVGMALRSAQTLMSFYKSDASTSMLSLNATTNDATFLGNMLTFNDTTNTQSVTTNKLFFRLKSGETIFTPRLETNGYQNLSLYNTAGNHLLVLDPDVPSGLGRWSTVRGAATTAVTRTTAMSYTAGTPDNTTVTGDLTVTGSIHGTLAGSQTITHKTRYIGQLTLGCFVESTGTIYREPTRTGIKSTYTENPTVGLPGTTITEEISSTLSPYENCISIVRQATDLNNNIIGVCTEIIDHEFCKFATHGDCLVKCVSATYSLGDVLVPSINGQAKKANASDIMNCMCSMIPRLKVTSLETDEIDPMCVVGFISI